ncbi:MAG: hypothetical protein QOK21_371 [Solirubrobacteraceae bacterium]|jgi:hypothetical protein|nr:hypothetical protein [Solirubrobacteraceae bacterium]
MSDSGANPIGRSAPDDDTVPMTVIAVTHDTRLGRFGRRRDGDQGTGRRAAAARDDATMDLAREMQMQDLRERIERDDYHVDPHAIADAIVARLLIATRVQQCERPRD